MLSQGGQVWEYVVHSIYSNVCYVMARKENTQHLCLYKWLDLTPKSSSVLLSHTAALLPHSSWKPSLVSRVVLQSHLFLPVKPAHYVALPVPAVLIEYPISHLLTTHRDPSSINIVAGLVLIISVLADGRATETALQVIHSISFTNFYRNTSAFEWHIYWKFFSKRVIVGTGEMHSAIIFCRPRLNARPGLSWVWKAYL